MSTYQNASLCEDRLVQLAAPLEKTISFLVVSSLFPAITGTLLLYFSFLLFDVQLDFDFVLASFLLIFVVYSVNKLTDVKEDSINLPERTGFVKKNKYYIIVASIVSYSSALLLCCVRNPFAILVVLFPLCIGLIYSVRMANFRLKDVLCMKNIVVALSFAVGSTFFPLIVHPRTFKISFLVFYFIFLKVFISTVLFDVRDAAGDRMSAVRTIPVLFSVNKTKKLLLLLNSTLVVWLTFSYFQGFFHRYLLVLGFTIFYGYWYILRFCRQDVKKVKFFDLLVDGESIPIAILATLFALSYIPVIF
jgi:4-hydroxybenzoate polyprenyltransferase